MNRREILAVIPARGGSKGIPGKNLAPVAGKPMLAYTVEAALASPSVGRVVVSTDDNEIASVARELGAQVVERPLELARDATPTEAVVLHVLDALRDREAYQPELVLLLQVTSPLREAAWIEKALEIFEAEDLDSLFSATLDRGLFWEREGSALKPMFDPANRPRRQDIKPLLRENGALYLTHTRIWREDENRLGGKIGVLLTPPETSVDVDTPFDLEIVRFLMTKTT